MAHLIYESQLREALKLDDEIDRKPILNLHRKAKMVDHSTSVSNENSFANKSMRCATPGSVSSANASHGSFLDISYSFTGKSQSRSKSPGRCMPKLSVRGTSGQKTPSRNSSTPGHSDRFIPNRSTTDMERSHHLLVIGSQSNEDAGASFQQQEYAEKMSENLNDGVPVESRILSFKSKAPQTNPSHVNSTKVLYSASKPYVPKATASRHIPTLPEKILDAPELLDDYYLHLLDWSCNNHLSVALERCVYIWNAGDGSITPLAQFEEPEYVCSLSWIKEGNVLAVGISDGSVQLWDICHQKKIRTMTGHQSRVASLSWNSYVLSSGSRLGPIINHDVRVAEHITATLLRHAQEVCGLKWSPDGKLLASGGNDNQVIIWKNGSTSPLHIFTAHQAAVKGLAWCPWQNSLLASGGGTADRTIKLWNTSTGNCIKSVTTNSQVSALVWSDHYRELISGHGFSNNQLTLWKYPTFAKIKDLTGHTGRVLELCASPDGQTVVSAAADETIRLWKCWAFDKQEKKVNRDKDSTSVLFRALR